MEQLHELRPFLDFHMQSLALLAGITGSTMQCVIRQLNSSVAELFGSNTKLLTQFNDLEPHPFVRKLFQGDTVFTLQYSSIVFLLFSLDF